MEFIVVRLGKDSLPEIKRIDEYETSTFVTFSFEFTCKQVEKSINEGSYVFIYLGSDNNKGIQTKWKQGLRAIGHLSKIKGWKSFQEETTLEIKVLAIFPESYDQFDFLDESPLLYRHFSQYPIIGIRSSRNNSVQKVNDGVRENSSALLTALSSFDESLSKQLQENAIDLIPLLSFKADFSKTSNGNVSGMKGINKIFYGAPGTGKSHKIKEIVEGNEERTERVTFHPEYDYSSFVGGYKPTMNGENIRYEFVPQAFTNIYIKAWNDLEIDYYLVIEEINRGNCAEIFGDIFQLLDRSNDYKITPSKELREYLQIQLTEDVKANADKLLLPPNLNILATMNTSDQSLFPMDSAFKRRWDWEYIPINYEESETNGSSRFKVQLSDTESFSWLIFIKSVNSLIKSNDNLGMDKCLGNYFIKPESDIIELETFINKAVFYLWNDVFKDEIEELNIFKDKVTYEDFFPLVPNGLDKVKEILDILKVDYKASGE